MAKVTFYIDDETWARFKRRVVRRSGTLRGISRELQAIVQDSLLEENLSKAFRALGYEPGAFPSDVEVSPVVPHEPTSSAAVTRELRGKRHNEASLSRH